MSEHPEINDTVIESKVPGEQRIRSGVSEEPQGNKENSLIHDDNVIATKDDFTLSPVITVTKNEAAFIKGDMKLQKVTVTEDISDDSSIIIEGTKRDFQNQNTITDTQSATDMENAVNSETGEELQDVKKVSKIPRLRFRAAVNKVRSEQRNEEKINNKEVVHICLRRSSIPRLKDTKVPPSHLEIETKEESIKLEELVNEVTDAEFDKIYEEVVEKAENLDHSNNTTSKIDPKRIETKFDEIIHAYDDNKIQPNRIEKTRSKIPLLKRKSEQEIEVKTNKKELPRKGSLGKNPLPTTFREKTFKSETKISQKLNKNNTCNLSNSKTDVPLTTFKKETDTIPQITDIDNESKTEDSTVEISSIATVTKIPTIHKNNTKISSIVLNNHPIRVNSNKNTVKEETSMQSKHTDSTLKHNNSAGDKNDITIPLEKISNEIGFSEINGLIDSGLQTTLSSVLIPEKIAEIPAKLNLALETESTIESKYSDSTLKHNNSAGNKNDITVPTEKISNEIEFSETNGLIDSGSQTTLSPVLIPEKMVEIPATSNLALETETAIESKYSDSTLKHNNSPGNKNNITISTEIISNEVEFSENNSSVDSGSNSTVSLIPEHVTDISSKSNLASEIYVNENKKTEYILNSVDIIKTQNEVNTSENYSIGCKQEDNEKLNEIRAEIDLKDAITFENNNFDSDENKTPIKSNENACTIFDNDINVREKNEIKEINNLHSSQYLNREINENTSHHEVHIKPEVVNFTNIKESAVIIKFKSEIKEVGTTKENYVLENVDKQINARYESKEYNQTERIPVKYKFIRASQTVDERNEEDIIILKGKVNRVISRLDSTEPKINKKALNDLPNQSVKSKISLFESNEQPVIIKSLTCESNKYPKEDKPRIIDVLLKEKNNAHSKFNNSNESKISANVEHNTIDDKVKITYELKDDLAQWEKHNTNKPLVSKFDEKKIEDELDKNIYRHNTNNYNSKGDSDESNRKTNTPDEDDVFARKSAEIINAYKISQQKKNINVDSDMKRAKSLAELDLGDAVTGKVKKMIYRMKSVDKIEWRRDVIDLREKPRKGSVSEKIALFEGRLPPTRHEAVKVSPHLMTNTAPSETREHIDMIAELVTARVKYGKFENMTYVEIGAADVPSMWVGTAGLETGTTRQLIRTAIDLGYRAFDTAYVYGTEKEVGEAINEKILDGTVKREELFIASKLWSTFHRTDLVEKACGQSLETMGLDYFDLYMIHNPMSFKEGSNPIPMIANVLQYSEHDYLDAWFGIENVVKKGLVKRAGVSNFNTKQIQRILDKGKLKPVVNQVESHPYLNQLGLENFCGARNIKLSVFGVLGSKGTPAEWKSGLSPAIDDPLVKLMAAGLDITPAQLLISYQLNLGRVVVVKSSSAERLWENLQAINIHLLPKHITALHSLNKNRRMFTFKGMGDTHKNYPFAEF